MNVEDGDREYPLAGLPSGMGVRVEFDLEPGPHGATTPESDALRVTANNRTIDQTVVVNETGERQR